MCLLMVVVFNFISDAIRRRVGPARGYTLCTPQTHRNLWFHLVSNFTLVYELPVNQSIVGWKWLWELVVVGLGREG